MLGKIILEFTLNLINNNIDDQGQIINSISFTIERALNVDSILEQELKVAYDQVANEMWEDFKTKFDEEIVGFTDEEKENYSIKMKREKKITDDDIGNLYIFKGGDYTITDINSAKGDDVVHKIFIMGLHAVKGSDFICERNTPDQIAARELVQNIAARIIDVMRGVANAVRREVGDEGIAVGFVLAGAAIAHVFFNQNENDIPRD